MQYTIIEQKEFVGDYAVVTVLMPKGKLYEAIIDKEERFVVEPVSGKIDYNGGDVYIVNSADSPYYRELRIFSISGKKLDQGYYNYIEWWGDGIHFTAVIVDGTEEHELWGVNTIYGENIIPFKYNYVVKPTNNDIVQLGEEDKEIHINMKTSKEVCKVYSKTIYGIKQLSDIIFGENIKHLQAWDNADIYDLFKLCTNAIFQNVFVPCEGISLAQCVDSISTYINRHKNGYYILNIVFPNEDSTNEFNQEFMQKFSETISHKVDIYVIPVINNKSDKLYLQLFSAYTSVNELDRKPPIFIGKDCDSYYDYLQNLSLPQLEQKILAYYDSSKGSADWKCMKVCLHERSYKLDTLIKLEESHLPEILRVNKMLSEKCIQVRYELIEILEKVKNDTFNYSYVEVTAIIFPLSETLNIDDGSGSDYATMSEILIEDIRDSPLVNCFEISMIYDKAAGNISIYDSSYFDDNQNLIQDRARDTFWHFYEQVGSFDTCYALHCLYDHSNYSLQDIFRIKGFDSEIKIEFSSPSFMKY